MTRIRVDLERIASVSPDSAGHQVQMEANLQTTLVQHRDTLELQIVVAHADIQTIAKLRETDHLKVKYDEKYTLSDFATPSVPAGRPFGGAAFAAFNELLGVILYIRGEAGYRPSTRQVRVRVQYPQMPAFSHR